MNTSLQNLDLSYNGIGEKRANALTEVLKTNTSLQNLDLSHMEWSQNISQSSENKREPANPESTI
ncbi:hypothetical protein BC936DRAFT_137097, partial [Jimgerdemannia flammicorona]